MRRKHLSGLRRRSALATKVGALLEERLRARTNLTGFSAVNANKHGRSAASPLTAPAIWPPATSTGGMTNKRFAASATRRSLEPAPMRASTPPAPSCDWLGRIFHPRGWSPATSPADGYKGCRSPPRGRCPRKVAALKGDGGVIAIDRAGHRPCLQHLAGM